ncbi:MAG: alpha/beta fold hydrolase [Chloroflexi bacterium]|nr:alpha/beta fold hydrolase [Chloroflexota bacterium]
MTQHAHLDPAAFFLDGGDVGALLIHGFTGSPPEMRLIGDYFHGRGVTVSAPLLPGHGASVADMNRCRYTDWIAAVEQALADLRTRCCAVFAAGLSMGSLLALHLAADHPELTGVIAYSPATWVADRRILLTPLGKRLIATLPAAGESDLVDPQAAQRLWCYDHYPVAAAHELLKLMQRVRRRLPRVVCPLLIVYSTRDRSIHPASAIRTFTWAGAQDKQLLALANSGHAITVDAEWETVAARTLAFMMAHTPRP